MRRRAPLRFRLQGFPPAAFAIDDCQRTQKNINDAGKKADERGAFSSDIRLGSDYP
jgi:hypothetical protein